MFDEKIKAINDSYEKFQSVAELKVDSTSNILVHNFLLRKKREIIATQYNEFLRALFSSPSDAFVNRDSLSKLSQLIKQYESKYGFFCDTSEIEEPPKCSFILTKVIKDCGTIVTSIGQMTFNKGSIMYLNPEDAYSLIKSGVLEKIL
jgi:hypothetical protein